MFAFFGTFSSTSLSPEKQQIICTLCENTVARTDLEIRSIIAGACRCNLQTALSGWITVQPKFFFISIIRTYSATRIR